MALWIYNPYNKDFALQWNAKEYLLEAKEWNLIPEDLVRAYFPTKDFLASMLPPDRDRALLYLRGLIEVYLSRWGSQIGDFYKLSGDMEMDIENFFDFIEKFEITEIKPPTKHKKTTETKEETKEKIELEESPETIEIKSTKRGRKSKIV